MKKLLLPFLIPSLLGANVSVVWDANTDVVAGYKVYVAAGTNNFQQVLTTSETTAKLENISSGVQYRVYITAYNSLGLESDPSNIVGFSFPSAPTGLQAIIISGSTTNIIRLDIK